MSDTPKYIILRLDDAKAIADELRARSAVLPKRVRLFADRAAVETGGDIRDIVERLRTEQICQCCVIESQEEYCSVHPMKKQGRRLRRLVERADAGGPIGSEGDEP